VLHPKRDKPETHIVETAQGRLSGLTARGWSHIQRLRLNRIQLVEMRGLRRMERTLRDELAQAQEAEDLYRQLLGIEKPWTVDRVEWSDAQLTGLVLAAHSPDARAHAGFRRCF